MVNEKKKNCRKRKFWEIIFILFYYLYQKKSYKKLHVKFRDYH